MFNNDLVYYQKGGKVKALGYTIENALLEKGLPVFGQSGGGHALGNLVVPAGLLLLQQTFQSDNDGDDNNETSSTLNNVEDRKNVEVIGEGLFDKLLQLMNTKQKKRCTQRRKRKRKKHTRKRSR